MSHKIQLPCDGEGVCMLCHKVTSVNEETITCSTCNTPWHMPCLTPESTPSSSGGDLYWICPDCSGNIDPTPVTGISGFKSSSSDFIAAIHAIEANASLTEEMKAKKRQILMNGEANDGLDENEKDLKGKNKVVDEDEEMLNSVQEIFNYPICLELAKRPITTPCGHNFCLKCFEKWISQAKFECAKCRAPILKMAAKNVCVNVALAAAIRLAKNSKCAASSAPKGIFMVCRYLFVKCDNKAPPCTSNEHGDRPRPLPSIDPELVKATDPSVREESSSWDFDEAEGCSKWVKPSSPPASRINASDLDTEEKKRMRKARKATRYNIIRGKLLKHFTCQICGKLMNFPVTTPCGHNFCKACLGAKFSGISHVRERSSGGHTLRAKKNIMICPSCPMDIADFVLNPQVNREIMDVIEKLTKKEEEEPAVVDDASIKKDDENSDKNSDAKVGGNTDSEDDEEEEEEFDTDLTEAEELPSKRMKLDSHTPSSSHCKNE